MRQATADVLEVLRDAHAKGDETFGMDIMSRTGRASGTVYPILSRLEDEGWIEGHWEDPNRCEGRPPRRYYSLTGLGAREARAALARLESRSMAGPRGPAWET
jgi:PadR family transcriptional regulator PadR